MTDEAKKKENEDKKTIVPTLIIGVGGTGMEVISRLRRLVTESYGSLKNLPVLGFLHIDTDQNYKLSSNLMAGPALENFEKYWSRVQYQDAEKIVKSPENFPWFSEWLPTELISKPRLLAGEEGAGQVRACGRFSFFYNYDNIRKACEQAKKRVQGHEFFMEEKYKLKVLGKINIFVIGSISGGTGSGMLIDLGYSLRNWFQGENALETTVIMPSPDAFSGVHADKRVKENGYAALMELNYFSDEKTTFSVRYGAKENTRVESTKPPYDYIYIVGTNNDQGGVLKLDEIRETIAHNIFLDLVSDYSPYKRSIRDNMKSQTGGENDQPPQGRSYPRNFMSFGLASIEVPIYHIRTSLAARLAADLLKWWQNSAVLLPPEPQKVVEDELKEMKLLGLDLLKAILKAGDRPYQEIVDFWISNTRQEIIYDNLLQSTAQAPNPFKETGKILNFVDGFLKPKVRDYIAEHFRDSSPDPREHGDFLLKMYDNRNQALVRAAAQLQEKLYAYLSDRHRGPKFLQTMLDLVERRFNTEIERFEREAEETWPRKEQEGFKEYEAAISRINEFRNKWGVTKQDQMNKDCDAALKGLKKYFEALLGYKSRKIAAEVLRHLIEVTQQLKRELAEWKQRVAESEAKFREISNQEANKADGLEIVGVKLFKREELNELYEDFLATKQSLNVLCQQLTEQVLEPSSSLWSKSRDAAAIFRLLDIEKIPKVQYDDFEEIVGKTARTSIATAPAGSKLFLNMDACDRFMSVYPEERDRESQIDLLFKYSKPLVRLDPNPPKNSDFSYILVSQAGLLGGEKTDNPAAKRVAAILKKYFTAENAIAPLTERERHKILAIHEVGGFSLRCILGTEQLRKSYQTWRGNKIQAERAKLKGVQADIPISVHMQNDIIFWDFVPADPKVEELVAIARAVGILRKELNQATKKDVICYYTTIHGEREKVTLAANWEDAVQVLELPDCRSDRLEVQRQLDELLDRSVTDLQKQELRNLLDAYLAARVQDFRRDGGEDSPMYRREKTIVREFQSAKQLGFTSSPPPPDRNQSSQPEFGFTANPPAPNPPAPNPPTAQYEEYLTQLSRFGVPKAAFISAAEAKATELKLERTVAESIWRKLLGE